MSKKFLRARLGQLAVATSLASTDTGSVEGLRQFKMLVWLSAIAWYIKAQLEQRPDGQGGRAARPPVSVGRTPHRSR